MPKTYCHSDGICVLEDVIGWKEAKIKGDSARHIPLGLSRQRREDPLREGVYLDRNLLGLIEKLLKNNRELHKMQATLSRFRALNKISQSKLFPVLDAYVLVGRFEDRGKSEGITKPFNYRVSLPASYELDVWNKLHLLSDSDFLSLSAAEQHLASLSISLTSELVEKYFMGLLLQKQLDIIEEIIHLNRKMQHILQKQFKTGIVTKDTIYKNRQSTLDYKSFRIDLKNELALIESSIKVLVGEYPKQGWLKGDFYIPEFLREIPVGLPSELLKERPDLKALQLELDSLKLKVDATYRNLFPSFRLLSDVGANSRELEEFVDEESLFWNLFLEVKLSLFDGEKKKAEYQLEEAKYLELLQDYKNSLLNAFKEVEDALILCSDQFYIISRLSEKETLLLNQIELAEKMFELGTANILPLLSSKQNYLLFQMKKYQAQMQLISYRIQLIRALGCGWWKENVCKLIENKDNKSRTLKKVFSEREMEKDDPN